MGKQKHENSHFIGRYIAATIRIPPSVPYEKPLGSSWNSQGFGLAEQGYLVLLGNIGEAQKIFLH